MAKIIIIDGKNYFTRMFMVALRQKQNIMRFVIDNLIDYKKNNKRSKIIFAFDTTKSKRRLELYPEYKAGRVSSLSDEERELLNSNLSDFRDIIRSLGIRVLTGSDYEADDYIAKLVQMLKRNNYITINSMDEDFLQLVDEHVDVYLSSKRLLITTENINNYLGIDRQFFLDWKSIVGDKSDNIAGIKGVGVKKAVAYINEFGTFDEILEGIKNKDKINKTDEKMLAGVAEIDLYKKVIDFKYCFEDKALSKLVAEQVKATKTNEKQLIKILDNYNLKTLLKDVKTVRMSG